MRDSSENTRGSSKDHMHIPDLSKDSFKARGKEHCPLVSLQHPRAPRDACCLCSSFIPCAGVHRELLAGRNQRRSSMNVPSLCLQLKCSATWDNCLLTLRLPALGQDVGMSFALLLRKRTEGETCGCQQRSTEDN